jgi:thioredoxin-like negative regulator of GroEL
LFAVHPVHVEVVASIENRKDILAMIGAVASVLLYRARRPVWGWAGSLVALLLALHAKDAAAIGVVGVLPLAGLLPRPDADVPGAERVGTTSRRLAPLVAIGVAATLWYGGNLAAKFRPDAIAFTTVNACTTYGEVLGTSAAAVPDVARLLVFPGRLSADYPARPQGGVTTAPALAGIALIGLGAAAALALRARAPVAAFAVAWIMLTYLPVSNVIPLTGYFVADRYLYLPSFGFCLLVAFGLDALFRVRATLAVAAAAGILAAGTVRTLVRIRDWRDDLTLWTAALRAVPEGSAHIYAELGRALMGAGRLAEAVPNLETAVALDPTRADTESDLGLALLQSGRAEEAIPAFRRAVALWPENPLIRFNLARTLLATGERDEAIAILRVVAGEEAWRDLTPGLRAALTARGMRAEDFRLRVQRWLARNAAAGELPPP